MSIQLSEILKFTKLIQEFQSVERIVYVLGKDRLENDVEHSYSLAMLAWYIADAAQLPLDREKIIRYALIHDFVEVYAGDTFLYSPDQQFLRGKAAREAEAQEKLKSNFVEFPGLHAAIEEYHAQSDAESRFVYVLDKMEPVLKIYLDEGRNWKENKVTFDMLLAKKKDKAGLSPELKEAFDELIDVLEREKERLFFPGANFS